MSAPRVVIVDSCVYFRLARTIHPLLVRPPFGLPPPYSLYIVERLHEEYMRSPRLLSRFEWVREKQYVDDRSVKTYKPKGSRAKDVMIAYSYVVEQANGVCERALSKADLWAIAVVIASIDKDFVLVTDDVKMRQTTEILGGTCWSVLQLLSKLEKMAHVTASKIDEAVEYMEETDDLPMGRRAFIEEFTSLFDRSCPLK